MKESGVNYFYGNLGLDTGAFAVLYTFESNAGTNIPSVSGGQTGFSGTLNSASSFWVSPGSGFFSGTTLTINNASGLDSTSWTKVFVYEKVNVDPCILFDSIVGTSGYRIGITKANKPYFESINQEPIVAGSLNQYSSKNVVSFTYLPNYLMIGLYNWNSQTVEAETFSYPFQVARSDAQRLGGQFTGYMDMYMHFTTPLSAAVQGQLFSGLFAYPTGIGYQITNVCVTGITGYQNVVVFTTGVTGYTTTPGSDEGQGYYTGAFPTTSTQGVLTGYLSTGLYASGVSGSVCYPVTGAATTLYQLLTGYAASFGMEKIQYFSFIDTADTTKNSVGYTPWDDTYNRIGLRQYSGYFVSPVYDTGYYDLFLNGVALGGSGWSVTGSYIIITGAAVSDTLTYDLRSGSKQSFQVTGITFAYPFGYTGQELYVNGVNLVSGLDFSRSGTSIVLSGAYTGIVGDIFEYPVFQAPTTGRHTNWTGLRFWRGTSSAYMNGVRQTLDSMYVEGAIYDKLSGTFFNPLACVNIYDNTDLYWE